MTFSAVLGGIDLAGASGPDANGVQWTVDTFTGWGGVAPTIQVVQKPRSNGGWAGTSFGGSRHISIGGLIIAPSQDILTAAVDSLISAASLSTTPLTVTEQSRTRIMNVRLSDEVIVTYVTNVIATWSIQFVAVDPRKFATALSGFTMLPVSSGGITVPFTLPTPITSTVISGSVALSNPGNATGPVVIRIDGPCTGPQITHVGVTGSSLTFSSSLALGTGEWLTINMDTRQALGNDQANRASYITSRGWSGFDPGANTWAFTAAVFNAASKMTVTATPAWN